jgi:hypothetical protein
MKEVKFLMSEEVKNILIAIMMRRWKDDIHCDLVFTTDRLIVAKKGFLGQASRQIGEFGGVIREQEKLEELKQLSPENILKSHEGNFDLPYSEITKVEVGKKWGTFRLHIHTPKETLRFKFAGIQAMEQFRIKGVKWIRLEDAEGKIRSLLPDKVPVEKVDRLD